MVGELNLQQSSSNATAARPNRATVSYTLVHCTNNCLFAGPCVQIKQLSVHERTTCHSRRRGMPRCCRWPSRCVTSQRRAQQTTRQQECGDRTAAAAKQQETEPHAKVLKAAAVFNALPSKQLMHLCSPHVCSCCKHLQPHQPCPPIICTHCRHRCSSWHPRHSLGGGTCKLPSRHTGKAVRWVLHTSSCESCFYHMFVT